MSRYAFFLTEVNTSILNKYLKFIWSVFCKLLNCFCLQQIVTNLLPRIVCVSVNFMAQVWGGLYAVNRVQMF